MTSKMYLLFFIVRMAYKTSNTLSTFFVLQLTQKIKNLPIQINLKTCHTLPKRIENKGAISAKIINTTKRLFNEGLLTFQM